MGKLADRFSAWLAEGEAIRLDVAALEDASAPAPVPAPPAPAPEPPPPAPGPLDQAPAVVSEALSRFRLVWFTNWARTRNYYRGMFPEVWAPGAAVSLSFERGRLKDVPPGEDKALILPEQRYTLMLDGQEVAATVLAAGALRGVFKFTAPAARTAPLAPYRLTIGGLDDGESQVTYFGHVEGETPALTASVQDSHALSLLNPDLGQYQHAWALVPAGTPTASWPTRDHAYTQRVEQASDIAVDMPASGDDAPAAIQTRRPGGPWLLTDKQQAYFWDQCALPSRSFPPDVLLLDGPRGLGTMPFTTHIEIGRATQTADPGSAPRKNAYLLNPWRGVVMSNTGAIRTLFGLRHVNASDGLRLERVGNWAGFSDEELARPHAPLYWGHCWDTASVFNIDTDAPPIPSEDNRQPHRSPPKMYVTDTRNEWLLKVVFDKASHSEPATITRIFEGGGLWDCVEDESTGTMLVSLRAEHRVVRMSFQGQILETIIGRDPALPGDAYVDARHIAQLSPGVTLEQARAQPILAPEGLSLMDGVLRVGSRVQQRVTFVDLATKNIVRKQDIPMSLGGAMFLKIATDDGSFHERGMLGYATFEVTNGSRFKCIKNDGTEFRVAGQGAYGPKDYVMSVGFGGGRMIVGGSDYGLTRHFSAPAMDIALYQAGEKEFQAKHLRLVHGPRGVGPYAIPDNASEALRYYMTCNREGW